MLSYIRYINRLTKGTIHMLKDHLRCHSVVATHLKWIFLIPLSDLCLPLFRILRFCPL